MIRILTVAVALTSSFGQLIRSSDEQTCRVQEVAFAQLFSNTSPTLNLPFEHCTTVLDPQYLKILPKPGQGSLPVYLLPNFVIKDFSLKEGDIRLGQTETMESRREKDQTAFQIIQEYGYDLLKVPASCIPESGKSMSINERLPIQNAQESTLLYNSHPELFTKAVEQFTSLILHTPMTDIASPFFQRFDNVVPYLVKEGNRWIGHLGLVDLEHLLIDESTTWDHIKDVISLFPYHYKEILNLVEKHHPEWIQKSSITEVKNLVFAKAAQHGFIEIFNDFLVDEDISAKYKGWALQAAAKYGHKEIVEMLLKVEGISTKDKGRALQSAAIRGHKEIVEILLKVEGISTKDKGTSLTYVAKLGRKEIVKMLLKVGGISTEDKGLAVTYAAKYGHKEIVEMLLEATNPNAPPSLTKEPVFLF